MAYSLLYELQYYIKQKINIAIGMIARLIEHHVAAVAAPHLSFSSFLSGVWSTVSLSALLLRQSMARLSPTLATTSSMPSLSSATVAVVPALSTEAVKHQRESPPVKPDSVRCMTTLHWTWHGVKIMHSPSAMQCRHIKTHITLYLHRLYFLTHTALMNSIE